MDESTMHDYMTDEATAFPFVQITVSPSSEFPMDVDVLPISRVSFYTPVEDPSMTIQFPPSFITPIHFPQTSAFSQDPPSFRLNVPHPRAKPAKTIGKQRQYTSQQWEDKKDLIERLWLKENRPWTSVKAPHDSVEEILRLKYDFPVTRRQFLRRIKEWGFLKNIKDAEMQKIQRIEQLREKTEGKKTEFKVRGRQLPLRKIKRWQRSQARDSIKTQEDAEMMQTIPDTPIASEDTIMEISYQTPEEQSSPTHISSSDETPPSETTSSSIPEGSADKRLQYDGEDLTTRLTDLDVMGSPRLSRLMQALKLEISKEVPPFSLDSDILEREDDDQDVQDRPSLSDHSAQDQQQCAMKFSFGPQTSLSPFPTTPSKIITKSKTSDFFRYKPLSLQDEELQLKYEIGDLIQSKTPIRQVLPAMTELAYVFLKQRKYRPAESLFRRVAVNTSKLYGKTDIHTFWAYAQALECLLDQGQLVQAEKVHRRLEPTVRKILTPDHELVRSIVVIGARISVRFERYDEAEIRYRELIQIILVVDGPKHQDLMCVLGNLAHALYGKDLPRESEEIIRTVITFQQLGIFHASKSKQYYAIRSLARALIEQGKYEEGELILRQLLQKSKLNLGAEHPSSLSTLRDLVRVFYMQSKLDEAKTIGEVAYKAHRKLFGAMHPKTLDVLDALTNSYFMLRHYKDAAKYYALQVEAEVQIYGEWHMYPMGTREALGWTHSLLGNLEESIRWYEEALRGYVALHKEESAKAMELRGYIRGVRKRMVNVGREDGIEMEI